MNEGPISTFLKVTCYLVETLHGKGTEEEPYRRVTYWYTEDGSLICYRDPHLEAASNTTSRPEGE